MSGLSWLGVEVTASLPSPSTISQAQPLPKRPAGQSGWQQRQWQGGGT